MTKIVKTKKKRALNLNALKAIACTMLTVSLMTTMFSNIFLHTYNNGITVSIENINREATMLESQNNALNLEIQNLISKDRVYDIATEAGLSQNQNNVISIVEGE